MDKFVRSLKIEVLPKDVKQVVTEMHNLDPSGENFRYSARWDPKSGNYVPSRRLAATNVDVVQMGKDFEQASQWISGIIDYLSEYRQWQADIADIADKFRP